MPPPPPENFDRPEDPLAKALSDHLFEARLEGNQNRTAVGISPGFALLNLSGTVGAKRGANVELRRTFPHSPGDKLSRTRTLLPRYSGLQARAARHADFGRIVATAGGVALVSVPSYKGPGVPVGQADKFSRHKRINMQTTRGLASTGDGFAVAGDPRASVISFDPRASGAMFSESGVFVGFPQQRAIFGSVTGTHLSDPRDVAGLVKIAKQAQATPLERPLGEFPRESSALVWDQRKAKHVSAWAIGAKQLIAVGNIGEVGTTMSVDPVRDVGPDAEPMGKIARVIDRPGRNPITLIDVLTNTTFTPVAIAKNLSGSKYEAVRADYRYSNEDTLRPVRNVEPRSAMKASRIPRSAFLINERGELLERVGATRRDVGRMRRQGLPVGDVDLSNLPHGALVPRTLPSLQALKRLPDAPGFAQSLEGKFGTHAFSVWHGDIERGESIGTGRGFAIQPGIIAVIGDDEKLKVNDRAYVMRERGIGPRDTDTDLFNAVQVADVEKIIPNALNGYPLLLLRVEPGEHEEGPRTGLPLAASVSEKARVVGREGRREGFQRYTTPPINATGLMMNERGEIVGVHPMRGPGGKTIMRQAVLSPEARGVYQFQRPKGEPLEAPPRTIPAERLPPPYELRPQGPKPIPEPERFRESFFTSVPAPPDTAGARTGFAEGKTRGGGPPARGDRSRTSSGKPTDKTYELIGAPRFGVDPKHLLSKAYRVGLGPFNQAFMIAPGLLVTSRDNAGTLGEKVKVWPHGDGPLIGPGLTGTVASHSGDHAIVRVKDLEGGREPFFSVAETIDATDKYYTPRFERGGAKVVIKPFDLVGMKKAFPGAKMFPDRGLLINERGELVGVKNMSATPLHENVRSLASERSRSPSRPPGFVETTGDSFRRPSGEPHEAPFVRPPGEPRPAPFVPPVRSTRVFATDQAFQPASESPAADPAPAIHVPQDKFPPEPLGAIRKVKIGDPVPRRAEALNAMITAAEMARQRREQAAVAPRHRTYETGTILVRNDSGQDAQWYDVLGIQAPLADPGEA